MELPTPSIIWSFIYFNLTTQVDFDVISLYSVNITYFKCFKGIQFLYSTNVLLCSRLYACLEHNVT